MNCFTFPNNLNSSGPALRTCRTDLVRCNNYESSFCFIQGRGLFQSRPYKCCFGTNAWQSKRMCGQRSHFQRICT